MDQFYHGGESVCRNKYLQQMFTLMGAAEKAGSGADKILQGWKEADYRSPELKERTQPDKVELKLPLVNLLSADITKLLKTLCDRGFLISYGFGRGSKYQINEEYEPSSFSCCT